MEHNKEDQRKLKDAPGNVNRPDNFAMPEKKDGARHVDSAEQQNCSKQQHRLYGRAYAQGLDDAQAEIEKSRDDDGGMQGTAQRPENIRTARAGPCRAGEQEKRKKDKRQQRRQETSQEENPARVVTQAGGNSKMAHGFSSFCGCYLYMGSRSKTKSVWKMATAMP
ncbi:MAG TPA: hypothetical protein H9857_01800 [Candidatus Desulfovibrio intestinigallinarum]|nr:hypothetical protein [Candidatus Desulfovibrio intestinigallinarum]